MYIYIYIHLYAYTHYSCLLVRLVKKSICQHMNKHNSLMNNKNSLMSTSWPWFTVAFLFYHDLPSSVNFKNIIDIISGKFLFDFNAIIRPKLSKQHLHQMVTCCHKNLKESTFALLLSHEWPKDSIFSLQFHYQNNGAFLFAKCRCTTI